MDRFKDKVAIVTGGANGIGKAMVTRLAEEGAKVAVADKDDTALAAICAELGDAVIGILADVTQREQVASLVWTVMHKYGHIDLLFNNAGVCTANSFLDESEENWDYVITNNTKGIFLVGQAVAREMVKQGRPGAIVNTGAVFSEIVMHSIPAYAASEGAVMQLTKAMALDLAKNKIRVNAVAPGLMLTRMTDEFRDDPEKIEKFMKKLIIQRFGTPGEAAATALFLASDEASFVNGATYYVDGGWRVQ